MDIPSMDVKGKIAVVTGTGSGIGQALAIGLASYGADVVVTELPSLVERAEATAQEIRALGRKAFVCPLDVTRKDSIEQMVDKAIAEFGRVDILVNNAGINIAKEAFEVTEEDWDRVLDTDLKGVFFCSQAVAREMIKQGGGCMVNVASVSGLVAYYKRAPYCSAKGGAVNLTRELAIEWAQHNIRVNAIAPVWVLTPLTQRFFDEPGFHDEVMFRMPLKRLAKPEDMIGAVVFLASSASSMVTGQTLVIDGGWTAM
jgi:NAD(P)-dependent dehydrogenase (short-subunit alcohol dehydrogenase family)